MDLNRCHDNGIRNLILSGWVTSKRTFADPCVHVQRFPDDNFIILLIYVDDGMLILG